MNIAGSSIIAALLIQLALGAVVLQAHPRRKANQCFLVLSLAAGSWLMSLFWAFNAKTPSAAEFSIRGASIASILIISTFNVLRLSLREGEGGWLVILQQCRLWLVGAALLAAFCLTKFYLRGAELQIHSDGTILAPRPIYNWIGEKIFIAGFLIAFLALVVAAIHDLRETRGGHQAELAFILIGGMLALTLSLPLSVLLERFVEPTRLLAFAPFRVVLFSAVVAYGVATRKIMDVGLFLRRLISYGLLTVYLLTLYAVVWWLVGTVLRPTHVPEPSSIAHIVAGIVIAFAMAPARGVSRRLAERLFISSERLDFRKTIGKATEIASSITTLQDLLQRFAGTVAEAVGAERVLILLPSREAFTTGHVFSRSPELKKGCQLGLDEPITNYLKTHREAIVLEELDRVRSTPELIKVSRRLRELNIAVAIGIFAREHLAGIMLLGQRVTGRSYTSVEQDALQVLCGQLAIAIDNAQLFTEVQNAKIYNEILLQNLTTGVIAVGVDERITVFNTEAGQVTGFKPTDVLDQPSNWLPAPLYEAVHETLRTGRGLEHREIVLQKEEESLSVRASTSIFKGQEGNVLGALMVLTDVTALKRLEHQIRRSDRLASLGTLSAGMAHEIKNPLVSIKTFAQLLPERYADSDFRETFSNLIGHEIDRIDSLVNQLLRFARPAKPNLQPSHVHQILEKALLLVGHRLYQKDIKLSRSWGANVDTIRADADQLEQVFLNFFINAMDAMKTGGELNISTQIRGDDDLVAAHGTNGDSPEVLRVTIRDTGEGIKSEDLAHVFDPFFTTKDYGTGLGLSVVHGIIQEHGGQIEVESELQKGTSFHILLPLVRFDSEVAAA